MTSTKNRGGATKRKRLSKVRLLELEATLLDKYPHMIPDTLKNVSDVGGHQGKRTAMIQCAELECDRKRRVATSDLHQVRYCTKCTDKRRKAARRIN